MLWDKAAAVQAAAAQPRMAKRKTAIVQVLIAQARIPPSTKKLNRAIALNIAARVAAVHGQIPPRTRKNRQGAAPLVQEQDLVTQVPAITVRELVQALHQGQAMALVQEPKHLLIPLTTPEQEQVPWITQVLVLLQVAVMEQVPALEPPAVQVLLQVAQPVQAVQLELELELAAQPELELAAQLELELAATIPEHLLVQVPAHLLVAAQVPALLVLALEVDQVADLALVAAECKNKIYQELNKNIRSLALSQALFLFNCFFPCCTCFLIFT